jgi:Tol biopolymer transport system component
VIYDCVPVGEADEFAYEQLNLIQTDDNSVVGADSQVQSCGGLGAFGLAGLFWSADSQYFYYTNAREGVPDGCGYWSPPFLRLDVSNPAPEYLGGGTLSADGTKLATWQDHELVVWDIDGGEMARLPATMPESEIGPVTWSPDGQSLVYVQVESHCPLSGMSSVVLVDLPELRQTLLLESETPTFGNAVWNDPDVLHLNDENGDEWRYTFSTDVLQRSP